MADDNNGEDIGRKGSVRRAREKARQLMDQEEHELINRNLSANGRRPPPVAIGKEQVHGAKRSVVQDPAAMSRPRRNTNPYAKEMAEAQAKEALQRAVRPPSAVDTFLNDPRGRRYPPSNPYHGTSPTSQSSYNTSEYGTTALPVVPSNDYSHNGQVLAHPAPTRRSNSDSPTGGRRDQAPAFYPIGSSVSPIPEEFPAHVHRNAKSFASSKAIPSSWGSAPFDSADIKHGEMPDTVQGTDGGSSVYNEDEMAQALQAKSALRTKNKNGSVDLPPGHSSSLARKVSLGKKGKGELRTINITKNPDSPPSHNRTTSERSLGVASEAGSVTSSGTIGLVINPSVRAHIPGHQIPPSFHNPKGQLRPSRLRANSHSSVESINDDEEPEGDEVPIIHKQPTNDSEFRDIELGGSRSAARRMSQFSDLPSPPSLNQDGKGSEVRSSLTSLPDLIRRATKLASNLDRNKTASKNQAGIFEMLSTNPELRNKERRYSGSITDILASFPPPGIQTPANNIPNSGDPSKGNGEVDVPKTKRRYCGLPTPALLVFCIGLVLLLALVITIPLAIVGKPRNHSPANNSSCEIEFPCKNGGISIGTLGACSCVCPEGFRGAMCNVKTDESCIVAKLKDDRKLTHDATVGSAIPRLLENSQADFDIPLDVAKLLSLFDSEEVSCNMENALVTFNNRNQKRGLPVPELLEGNVLGYHLQRRRPAEGDVAARSPQATTMPPQHTPTTTPTPTRSSSPTSTPTSTTTSPSMNVLDFARIAVLYVFEKTEKFNAANAAREAIQNALRRSSGTQNNTSVYEPVQLTYGEDKFLLGFDTLSISFFEKGEKKVLVGGKAASNSA